MFRALGEAWSPPATGYRYEERITLWRATSFEAAIERAEAEAAEYAERTACESVALAQAFHLYDEPGDSAEIFSLVRDSELAPDAYVDGFFDTGTERQQHTANSDR